MTKTKKTKCYIYTRVSTAIQVDGYSLEAQKEKIRKYAEYQDMEIAGEYSDEGFSGKNIKGRHEFQRMLNDIEDCKDGVKYVLVFKLSRFGRNAADILNSLQLMQDFGVNLICVEDSIDSSKEAGKLLISILAAVAEMERENIRVQTMAGREQKAREGKWNGGFAPYGYKLVEGGLEIADDEVEIIKLIYDRYIHTNSGINGVASYLNSHGYTKKLRQNNTISGFSSSFVKDVLDNPVYMGKIAYGRRKTEKKIGTRNEMHVVEQSEFPIYEGAHEAIISEEDWNLAQAKRKENAYVRQKVHDIDHAHILSGILKCPCCGKSLYGNIAKAHSKDNKTRYYYYCKNTLGATGHKCTFRLNIEQNEMNNLVASIISAMVKDDQFKSAIKEKIGNAVDTEELENEKDVLRGQLKQAVGTKNRLAKQMDCLDVDDPHYDRKVSDLQSRYDEQYDIIEDIENQIDEVQKQIDSIVQENLSGTSVYNLLLAFNKLYKDFTEAEQKEFMRAFIDRIDIYPEKPANGCWVKNIVFNFPVPINGRNVRELSLENETILDTNIGPINRLDRRTKR
ncbi:recombinase family protein [Pseudobutyrivibrio xylanivorans]|uniref:Site-specific DNA recombinase n=1 Tax=Pseudobutyrivibrio xylanivorans DSM 14809 TaxID=1123012 RepID=A0A1M6BP65_PSEXY|nr:recombinase family protein [Pseudobutyrivibrio xylanivorans]SHI50476.1 site-specific DNA recombinase [Pseudobutyrivibrio xylanivorans DSM 14809]